MNYSKQNDIVRGLAFRSINMNLKWFKKSFENLRGVGELKRLGVLISIR